MNRKAALVLILFVGFLGFGPLLCQSVKRRFAEKKVPPVPYSHALALLQNPKLEKVELKSAQEGYELTLRLADGRAFTAFTTDPDVHGRLLAAKRVQVIETREDVLTFREAAGFVSMLLFIPLLFFFATQVQKWFGR